MSEKTVNQLGEDVRGERHELLGRLDALRNALRVDPPAPESEALLSNVSEGVSTILAEHGGMAEELLCVYEQLGIVFEVTGSLPGVQKESSIVELLLTSLRRTFHDSMVAAAVQRGSTQWVLDDHSINVEPWLAGMIEESRAQSIVVVREPPDGAKPSRSTEAMVCPLRSGESFVCAIVLISSDEGREFRASDMLLVESLAQFCGDLIRNQHLLTELREASMAMIRSLVSAIDQKDPYTSGHSERVGYFALLLGRELGLSQEDLQMLQWSALLHDIGKIGIRDDVLKKKGKLDPEEWKHILEHPVRSHKVVKEVPQLAGALDGVLHHHEHYDGSGYPEKLVGEDIPLQARIIQVADIFDALTSTRSYRKAFDWRKALVILQEEAGTTVDPVLQKLFDRLVRRLLEGDAMSWETLLIRAQQTIGVDQSEVQTEMIEGV